MALVVAMLRLEAADPPAGGVSDDGVTVQVMPLVPQAAEPDSATVELNPLSDVTDTEPVELPG